MSKYTTELRFICENAAGLTESAGYNSVAEIIEKARPFIFSFPYPIFDESYRSVLESKILKHFYTDEIGEETVGLWKLRLDAKLNEIMPHYNKLYLAYAEEYNPLFTSNITRTHKGNGTKNDNESALDTANGTTATISDMSNTGHAESKDKTENLDKYSDTPQGLLEGVESGDYLTNARKIENESEAESDTNSTVHSTGSVANNSTNNRTRVNNATSTDEYVETVIGYDGYIPSELIAKYRDSLVNIDVAIITELEPLFMQVW